MPTELFFLNSKDRRKFFSVLEESFGFTQISFFDDFDFLSRRRDEVDRIFILKKSVSTIPFDGLRIDSLGVYFGELKDDLIRLSLEGSKILGPMCSKNVIELDSLMAKRYMSGEDVEFSSPIDPAYVILKSGSDYLGSARLKNGVLLNHVPKERRLGAII